MIVFIGFKAFKKEPVFVEKAYKSEKNISNKFKTLKFIAKISLVLLPLITIYSLSNTPPKSLLRVDVIKDKIGEFEFTLAEHDSGELEFGDNGIAFMTFNIQFCDECDLKIDNVFIKINKPLGDKNFGISFRGNYWERETMFQIPFNLNESSELYLTVVGRDKQIYQKSFNIKDNFEDSYNKFVEYAKKPKLEIQW
ncbi:hypothetical protein [Aliarcobacter cryaerophilus]|uniref:hypothetical protein n=1 Tax=Aliarcobacter cryaerophilus TaxID=28198 RepID=UPI0021B5554D|nr:hypothetical protein [Aliarcobacter cryaerophilus]